VGNITLELLSGEGRVLAHGRASAELVAGTRHSEHGAIDRKELRK